MERIPEDAKSAEKPAWVGVDCIDPNPWQPRRDFDQEKLRELAASIAQDGLLQPLVVSPSVGHPGRFLLVAGERRLRAAKIAGLSEVPVFHRASEANSQLRLALIENIQRSNLSPIDEALAYKNLVEVFGFSVQECAVSVGKSRSTVANAIRLLKLPESVQSDLRLARLSVGQARALLALECESLIAETADLVKRQQLNVRQTERLCTRLKGGGRQVSARERNPVGEHGSDLDYLEESLRAAVKTRVAIKGSVKQGRIELHYFSAAELERLIELLAGDS